MAALRTHRRKLGFCFKCGEQWSHGHRCPQHIPLHVLEEVLDALEPTDSDSKKMRPEGVKRSPPYFIKRKRQRLLRPRKNAQTLAHTHKGHALRRAQQGEFFYPQLKFALAEIRTRDLWGATLMNRANQLVTRPFAFSLQHMSRLAIKAFITYEVRIRGN